MTDNKPHDTLGWEFTYKLSDEVDCSSDISDRQDIEFITGLRKKQKTITGIKITVNRKDGASAELLANQIALDRMRNPPLTAINLDQARSRATSNA